MPVLAMWKPLLHDIFSQSSGRVECLRHPGIKEICQSFLKILYEPLCLILDGVDMEVEAWNLKPDIPSENEGQRWDS